MKNVFLSALIMVLAVVANAQQSQPADARIEYIKKYKDAAIEEMERAGIPASIKLAQAILESNAGQSTLAVEANNHFAIKCGSSWDGKSFYVEDDDRDGNGNIIKSCFRKYKRTEDSYEDHSDFLRDPKKYNRYGFLFQLNQQDYRSWCYGLQSAGYATSDTYAQSLISIIERYNLNEYDKMTAGDIPPPIANRRSIGRINDTKVVTAKSGETIEDIARIYRLKAENLIEYNDRGYARSDKLASNTRIYIQKKGKKWHGRSKYHFVKENQSMFDISQLYGMRLESLLKGNKMDYGEEPANGEQIKLKGYFWKKGPKPKLRRLEDAPAKKPNSTDPTAPGATTGNNQGNSGTRPTPPTPPKNDKMTTDEDELFEMGEGEVIAGDKKDNTDKPSPGKPATTGTPRPNDPTGTTTQPSSTTQPKPTKPTKPTGTGVYHTVVKGDTMYNISKRYGTTVARIRQLNNMVDDNIKIGQELRVQ